MQDLIMRKVPVKPSPSKGKVSFCQEFLIQTISSFGFRYLLGWLFVFRSNGWVAQMCACAACAWVSVWVFAWVCGCVGVCLRGCVPAWVCGCVSVWVCECVLEWVCAYVSVWVCLSGCVLAWVCGCVSVCVCECEKDKETEISRPKLFFFFIFEGS